MVFCGQCQFHVVSEAVKIWRHHHTCLLLFLQRQRSCRDIDSKGVNEFFPLTLDCQHQQTWYLMFKLIWCHHGNSDCFVLAWMKEIALKIIVKVFQDPNRQQLGWHSSCNLKNVIFVKTCCQSAASIQGLFVLLLTILGVFLGVFIKDSNHLSEKSKLNGFYKLVHLTTGVSYWTWLVLGWLLLYITTCFEFNPDPKKVSLISFPPLTESLYAVV